MAEHSLLLLGTPIWESPDATLSIPSQKGQALLWYCAAQPQKMFTRTHVACLLWGAFSEIDSRNSLNTTLTRLRRMLPVLPLRFSGDLLGWDPLAPVSVDLHEFLSLTGDEAEGGPAKRLRERLDGAVALRRGPFLDGVALPDAEAFMQWLEQERLAWDRRCLRALDRAVTLYESFAAWHTVLDRAHQALGLDPTSERFHRSIMVAYQRLGDRAAALAQYRVLKDILRSELDVAPDMETERLAEEIAGRIAPQPAVRDGDPPAPQLPPSPIGREQDLLRLSALLGPNGTHQSVVLCGEAGVGKTFLADYASHLPTGHATLVRVACYAEFRGLSLSFLTDLVRAAWPQVEGARLAAHLQDLVLLGRLAPDLKRALPQPTAAAPPDGDGRALLESVALLLELLPAPILLVVDDLQNADAESLLLIPYLLRRPPRGKIKLLATLRPQEVQPAFQRVLGRLEQEGRLATLSLLPLDPEATERFASGLLPPAEARRLHAFTGGNLRLITATLENCQSGTDRGSDPFPLTPNVRTFVEEALASLSLESLLLLEVLALFPAGLSFETLTTAVHQDGRDVFSAFERLLAAGFVTEEADAAGDVRVRFRREADRQVVLASLSSTRRRMLRQAVTLHA